MGRRIATQAWSMDSTPARWWRVRIAVPGRGYQGPRQMVAGRWTVMSRTLGGCGDWNMVAPGIAEREGSMTRRVGPAALVIGVAAFMAFAASFAMASSAPRWVKHALAARRSGSRRDARLAGSPLGGRAHPLLAPRRPARRSAAESRLGDLLHDSLRKGPVEPRAPYRWERCGRSASARCRGEAT